MTGPSAGRDILAAGPGMIRLGGGNGPAGRWRMIEAVVFDLDGVLVDSEPVWEQVRRQVVAEHGGHGSRKRSSGSWA
jgi:Predicted phosphatase/phosphohexomutase